MSGNIKSFLLDRLQYKKNNLKGDQLTINCLFHSDKNPSMGVYLTTGQYNCFSCGAKGGILDLTQKIHSITKAEAVTLLVNAGIFEDRSNNINKNTIPEKKAILSFDTAKKPKDILNTLLSGGYASVDIEATTPLTRYLEAKRGFDAYYLQKNKDILQVKKSFILEIKDTEGDKSIINIDEGSLIFIYRNHHGKIITFKFHSTKQGEGDAKLFLPKYKTNLSFFKATADDFQHLCFIVEGEMDAVALNSLGFNAISVGSLNNIQPILTNLLKECRDKICIALPDFIWNTKEAKDKFYKEAKDNKLMSFVGIATNTDGYEDLNIQYKDICEALVKDMKDDLLNKLMTIIFTSLENNLNYYFNNNYCGIFALHGKDLFIYREKAQLKVIKKPIPTASRFVNDLGNYIFGNNSFFSKAKNNKKFESLAEQHYNPRQLVYKNRPQYTQEDLFIENGELCMNSYVAGGFHAKKQLIEAMKKEVTKQNCVDIFKEECPAFYDYFTKILNYNTNGNDAIKFILSLLAIKWHEPNYKIQKIIVLQGEFGSGKGTFIDLIEELFGLESVNVTQNYGSQHKHNTDFANRLFWRLDEREAGNSKNRQVYYADLKDHTGAERMSVEPKYIDPYSVENYATPIVLSNSYEPVIEINPNDRRLVYFTSWWVRELKGANKSELASLYFANQVRPFFSSEGKKLAMLLQGFTGYDDKFIINYKSIETINKASELDAIGLFFEKLVHEPETLIQSVNESLKANERKLPKINKRGDANYYCEYLAETEQPQLLINLRFIATLVEYELKINNISGKDVSSYLNKYGFNFESFVATNPAYPNIGKQKWFKIDAKEKNKVDNINMQLDVVDSNKDGLHDELHDEF